MTTNGNQHLVVHQVERLKKSLKEHNIFMNMLYDEVFPLETEEGKLLMQQIKDSLNQSCGKALETE